MAEADPPINLNEWKERMKIVIASKSTIRPSERSKRIVRRYGFSQLSKQPPSIKSMIQTMKKRENRIRMYNTRRARDLIREIHMVREANRLISLYVDLSEQYRPHKKNDENLKQLDMVIHSLKMFLWINKKNKNDKYYSYSHLLEELQRIRKEISFEGGKRKTRKHKRNTRRS